MSATFMDTFGSNWIECDYSLEPGWSLMRLEKRGKGNALINLPQWKVTKSYDISEGRDFYLDGDSLLSSERY